MRDGSAILTESLCEVLSLDLDNDELVVESGVQLGTLQDALIPSGRMLPVSPGTGFVTVGGAIANDVHGKNHDADGSFGDHVNWIEVLTADGQRVVASAEEHADLFSATIGGCGMTGIILSASLGLMRVEGDCVRVCESRISSLEEFIDQLILARQEKRYSVGWIDALSSGRSLGRGILESADLAPGYHNKKRGKPVAVPFDFPSISLNRWTVRAFNELYFRRVPSSGRQRDVPIRKFLYPLDAISHWNRIYGRRGFDQFQCVIPEDAALSCLSAMLRRISASGIGSFLSVIKTLGNEGRGLLSFPRPGLTLALDFPRRKDSGPLISELNRMTADHAGCVYLAKDSWLSADLFARMYSRLPRFQEALARWDPNGRFSSMMADRLHFRRPDTADETTSS